MRVQIAHQHVIALRVDGDPGAHQAARQSPQHGGGGRIVHHLLMGAIEDEGAGRHSGRCGPGAVHQPHQPIDCVDPGRLDDQWIAEELLQHIADFLVGLVPRPGALDHIGQGLPRGQRTGRAG